MIGAATVAGSILGEEFLIISENEEPLCPIYACISDEGEQHIESLEDIPRLEEAYAVSKKKFDDNPSGASQAALIHDGYLTEEGVKRDMVFIVLRQYLEDDEEVSLTIAMPYRNPDDPAGFAAFKPALPEIPEALERCRQGRVPGLHGGTKGLRGRLGTVDRFAGWIWLPRVC